MKQKLKVWDLPTRLFHWLLAASVAFMWYSGEQGGDIMAWHLRCGVFIFGLLVFRICWGIWGSDTARFAQFFKPWQIGRYLKGSLSENEQPGHNPLGALMVVALIGAVLFQVVTGLLSSDENAFLYNGYLSGLAGSASADFRKLHIQFFDLLLILIGVHVFTVLLYKFVKKHNLITPMLTGYKYLEGKLPDLKFAGAGKFLAALAIAAAAVCVVVFAGA
ncbi:cytochrome b/b6 domain-containing protein [Neisseria wadsworthii]|uniref:cytochrome b/b6 domain-containing protein n=1 Tax=Neisseria wadsworthii TaxID=607711 RepID=UPI000D317B3E|nr:cytochrome b/b6 domain-containing protein [Neisseria wadsworthii]